MNEFPPGYFIAMAMNKLPAASPEMPAQTVEIDAGPMLGRYRVTFVVQRNPRPGMRSWFWVMETGVRLPLPGTLTEEILEG